MSKRRVEVVILCEDRQQEVFARYFLVSRGFEPRRMRPIISPSGAQSAEQFVRERFSREVRAYRSKRNQIGICLVVLIDADLKTLAERLGQLESKLQEDGLSPRRADDKIGIFIPMRNIETWIYYAGGRYVDELTVYPKLSWRYRQMLWMSHVRRRSLQVAPVVVRFLQAQLAPGHHL